MKKNKPTLEFFPCVVLTPLLLLWLFVGCGGPKQTPNAAHLQETSYNRKAIAAYESGKYDKALLSFTDALKASRAVEDIDLTAVNLINIAVVYRELGQIDHAHQTVDEILNASHVTYLPARIAEAALIKALLYFDAGERNRAGEWVSRAVKICPAAECGQMGRVYNLKAALALQDGDAAAAATLGEQGLKWNRDRKDGQETANSLRVLAEARVMENKVKEASALYEEALGIDKELGLSKKIALDLMGFGRLYIKQGDYPEALKYFRRAQSVSAGGGDEQGRKRAEAMIRDIEEKITPPPRPVKQGGS